jgi:LuxR family maltose regulon positive regulatory protein
MDSRNSSGRISEHKKHLLFPLLAPETNHQPQELMILNTKISKPPFPTDFVSRPHLVERLNKGLQHKLILLTAPAGYGKTTLLNEWTETITDSYAVSWISVDHNDTNTIRFWNHMISSLRSLDTSLANATLSPFSLTQLSSIENALTMFINVLSAIPHNLVLILDNYSAIDNPSIHKSTTLLLEYLPSHVHLVITCRTLPPLPLARLRIENQLVEISATDMRLTAKEIKPFLIKICGRVPQENVLTTLEDYTEGWIAGLHVAARDLQRHIAINTFNDIQRTGYHRYIRDYLDDEVFSPLPMHIQDFLLHTAILDHLSVAACDAITDQRNSLVLLEWLEQNNLFIIPLEKGLNNYRYHRLFRDFLLDRLQRIHPDLFPIVHRRASAYYEQNGVEIKAINHALAAHDIENVTRFIEKIWATAIETGEMSLLRRGLENLPTEIVHSSFKLAFFYAWYQFFMGNFSTVVDCLKEMKTRLATIREGSVTDDELSDLQQMQKKVEFLQALVVTSWCDTPLSDDLPLNVLKQISDHDLFSQCMGLLNTSITCWRANTTGSTIQPFKPTKLSRQNPRDVAKEVLSHCLLAQIHMQQGHLRHAERNFEQALQLMRSDHETLQEYGYPAYLGMGQLLYERNNLDEALMRLVESITQSQRQGNEEMLTYSYATLARVKQAQGEEENALQFIHLAEQGTQKDAVSFGAAAYVSICRARLFLSQGETAAAQESLRRSKLLSIENFNHTILARILLAQGRYEEAFKRLEQLFRSARKSKKIGSMIETSMLLALVCQKQAKISEALAFLEQALSWAETEGYFRLFVDEGKCMSEAVGTFIDLQQQREHLLPGSTSISYGKKLLATLRNHPGDSAVPHANKLDKLAKLNLTLAEPLKEREIEVLYFIAAGLSNQEIAQKMVVAITTVKWHIKNIYGKLNIRSRAEAIAFVHRQQLFERNE